MLRRLGEGLPKIGDIDHPRFIRSSWQSDRVLHVCVHLCVRVWWNSLWACARYSIVASFTSVYFLKMGRRIYFSLTELRTFSGFPYLTRMTIPVLCLCRGMARFSTTPSSQVGMLNLYRRGGNRQYRIPHIRRWYPPSPRSYPIWKVDGDIHPTVPTPTLSEL